MAPSSCFDHTDITMPTINTHDHFVTGAFITPCRMEQVKPTKEELISAKAKRLLQRSHRRVLADYKIRPAVSKKPVSVYHNRV